MNKEQFQSILGISYSLQKGPMSLDAFAENFPPTEANCQRAVQLFYAYAFNIYLHPSQCLSYEGYWHYGKTVVDYPHKPVGTKLGDIIYAARREPLSCSEYPEKEYSLHVGVVIPHKKNMADIFHAVPKKGTIFQTWDEFCRIYEPVRIKRFLHDRNTLNKV